jgi:hypothetical protein
MSKQKNPKPTLFPVRITFLATDEQSARLTAHSQTSGMPVATILRRAVDAFLPKAAKTRKAKPETTPAATDPGV